MSAGLKHRIFVVDDESIIASSLQLILMSQGFDAHSFADPLAALNAARSKSPDLLITDVMMPQMTGIELAVQIRQDCPNCKVMLFSGEISIINMLDEAQRDGHSFIFVDKPVHPAVLIETINEVLDDSRGLGRSAPPSCLLTVV